MMLTTTMKMPVPNSEWIGSLPHITGLVLNGGNITIGRVEPLDGIAVAADPRGYWRPW